MPDEPLLREQARTAVQNGKIPARPADRMWEGPGIGNECVICQRPIRNDEMEFATPTGDGPDLAKFHLHIRCFAAWEFERRKAGL
jgi:hypothetical protein